MNKSEIKLEYNLDMKSTNKTYNGWTNYETWNVKLWLDNDEDSYIYWNDTAHGLKDASNGTAQLADQLEAEHAETLPELTGWHADFLRAAFSEVNWYEIAEHLIEGAE